MDADNAATEPHGLLRRVGSRIGWNVCDQALSSLTNAALSILVARSVTADAFGAFALCFTIYAIVVGVFRGLIAEPLTVRYSDAPPDTFEQARGNALGSALAGGFVIAIILLALAPTQSELIREPLIALALCMPGLLVQDTIRLAFITEGRPRRAAANDFVWAALQFALVGWLLYADTSSSVPFVLAWGGAAIAAAFYGVAQTRTRPAIRAAGRWVREQLHLSRFFVAEFLAVLGSLQVALIVIAAVDGVDAVGAIRGATVVLGPLNILTFGAFAFSVPELVRRRALPFRQHAQLAAAISGTLFVAVAVWSTMMLLLPESIGVELLGDTWHDARAVLAPVSASFAGIAAGLGPLCTLRAFGAARATFEIGLVIAVLLLGLGTLGVILDGAYGAAVGLAVAQWISVPIVWYRMVVVVRARDDQLQGMPA